MHKIYVPNQGLDVTMGPLGFGQISWIGVYEVRVEVPEEQDRTAV